MSVRFNSSALWYHFKKDAVSGKAICNICKEKISYKSTTANLKSHLKRKHIPIFTRLYEKEPATQHQLENLQREISYTDCANNDSIISVALVSATTEASTLATTSATCSAATSATSSLAPISSLWPPPPKRQNFIDGFVNKKISAEQKRQIDSDVLDLCVDGLYPFSIVEERSFINLLRWIPGYKLPTRKTLSESLLQEAYLKAVSVIEKEISEEALSMCVTIDLWTSRVTESYIALTGHYINNDLEFKSVLLGCCYFSGKHTASNIALEVRILIDRWNLRGKINFSVSDNAANVVKALKDDLGWKHFGCFAHTLNLIVDDALSLCQHQIDKVKKIVCHFKKSTVSSERLAKFQIQQNQEPKRLIQDVETRWNSTFYMLKRFVELQDAVRSTVALVDRDLPIISNEDWTTFSQLCQVLEYFEELTSMMSAQKYLTGSLVIVMARCMTESCKKLLERPFNNVVSQIVLKLHNGLADRFKNVEQSGTFSLCTILDPRIKMQGFSDQREALKAKEKLRNMVASMISENSSPQAIIGGVQAISEPDECSPFNIMVKFVGKTTTQGTPLSRAITEVDKYLSEGILPSKNPLGTWNCPLDWWKKHRHVYPNLKDIFVRHCNIVASSVPCERMFSKAGLIINQKRTRLSSSKVEKIMFLNVNSNQQRFNKNL